MTGPRPLRWLALVLGLCCAPLAGPASAQEPTVSEYALKAVLFLKLPQFIYGLEDVPSETTLCVLGRTPLTAPLERLIRAPGSTRSFRLLSLAGRADASACQMLFIGSSEADDLDLILPRFARRPVVTVSDIDGFASAGGMVELAMNETRSGVALRLNRRAAQEAGLDFNAKLLRLARSVKP